MVCIAPWTGDASADAKANSRHSSFGGFAFAFDCEKLLPPGSSLERLLNHYWSCFPESDMLVLVVDNDVDTVVTQALILRRMGHEVLTSTSGAEVLPILKNRRPDVLLLDLVMPDTDGFDIASELKLNPDLRPTLLIAVTGYGDQRFRELTTQAGFDFHFVKPLRLAGLLAVMRSVTPDLESA